MAVDLFYYTHVTTELYNKPNLNFSLEFFSSFFFFSSPAQMCHLFFLVPAFNCSSFISHLQSSQLSFFSTQHSFPAQYCVVSVFSVRGRLFELRKRGQCNTHTRDENLWRGLSHHWPLCINTLAQTSLFTLLHHQTGFCLFLHNHHNHTHAYLHTSSYKLITVSKTKPPAQILLLQRVKCSFLTLLSQKHCSCPPCSQPNKQSANKSH